MTCAIQAFRAKVTHELCRMDVYLREQLRGDFLFFIDENPKFVLVLSGKNAFSGMFEGSAPVQLEMSLGNELRASDLALTLEDVLVGARAKIFTDEVTLHRLLSGTLKAKSAFLAGKVKVEGDLPGFMRLVSSLKSRGVTPPGAGSADSLSPLQKN